MSHQLGFLQCLKASFAFCATKHSRGFCFTSVIAYNSMKLQAELVSLAADKQSWEERWVAAPDEPHLRAIPVGRQRGAQRRWMLQGKTWW